MNVDHATTGDAASRQCGLCTACCTVMQVSDIQKPAGQRCRHAGKGCGIYDDRPQSCRGFTCLWLADVASVLSAEHRPDLIGLVLTDDSAAQRQTIAAREVFPGAAGTPAALEVIRYLRQFLPVRVFLAGQPPITAVSVEGRLID